MDVMKTCVLCELDIGDDGVTLSKELDTLRQTSDMRDDGKRAIMDLHTELRVHRGCRVVYTQLKSCRVVYTQLKRRFGRTQLSTQDEPSSSGEPEQHRMRSSSPVLFDYKIHCLFCGAVAGRKGGKISVVQTLSIQDNVRVAASARENEWGQIVLARVNSSFNLISLEARYHRTCYLKFMRPINKAKRPTGRPENPLHRAAFHKLCHFLEHTDENQYNIADLKNKFRSFLESDDDGFCTNHLQRKLKDYFGSRVAITSLPGRKSLLTFTSSLAAILNRAYYVNRASHCRDAQSEENQMIEAALDVNFEDISIGVFENNSYDSMDEIYDDAQNPVPAVLFDQLLREC